MRPKIFKKTTQLHVLVDESLLNDIKELASLQGIKYSEFVRTAIENEIARIDNNNDLSSYTEKNKKRKKHLNVYPTRDIQALVK